MKIIFFSADKVLIWLHAKTKLFSDLVAMLFVSASLLLWLLPARLIPDFYDRYYMSVASILGVAIIYVLPRLFRVASDMPGAIEKNKAVDYFQLLLTGVIFANALGEFGLYQLYKIGFEFDKFLHLGISFLSVLILPRLVEPHYGIPRMRAMWLVFLFIFCGGFVWELYEFLTDLILGTHLFGVYQGNITQDTKMDVLCNIIGATLGLMLGWVRMRKEKIVRRSLL